MDAHSRLILTALQSLLKAALLLRLPDRALRNIKAAQSSVDDLLTQVLLDDYSEPCTVRQSKRAA